MAWTRKFLTYLVVATLAIANGVAPGHAHARAQHAPGAAQAQDHDHGKAHDHHGQPQAHAHDADATAAKAAPCDDTGQPRPGAPDHSCCIASCTAVALIFASVSIERQLLLASFLTPLVPVLRSTTSAGIDRPPRLA
jgi:hypothetical protein